MDKVILQFKWIILILTAWGAVEMRNQLYVGQVLRPAWVTVSRDAVDVPLDWSPGEKRGRK